MIVVVEEVELVRPWWMGGGGGNRCKKVFFYRLPLTGAKTLTQLQVLLPRQYCYSCMNFYLKIPSTATGIVAS